MHWNTNFVHLQSFYNPLPSPTQHSPVPKDLASRLHGAGLLNQRRWRALWFTKQFPLTSLAEQGFSALYPLLAIICSTLRAAATSVVAPLAVAHEQR